MRECLSQNHRGKEAGFATELRSCFLYAVRNSKLLCGFVNDKKDELKTDYCM
jgi:hypothetical protein